jgi:hypothetical protein
MQVSSLSGNQELQKHCNPWGTRFAKPWSLIANTKGNIRDVHRGVSPNLPPRFLGEFGSLQPPLLGTANIQPHASCLFEFLDQYILRAMQSAYFLSENILCFFQYILPGAQITFQ